MAPTRPKEKVPQHPTQGKTKYGLKFDCPKTEKPEEWICKARGDLKDPIMALLPKLRNAIYEFTLVSEEPVVVANVTDIWKATLTLPNRIYRWREPALLRVNKAYRQEASGIYFLSHDFKICVRMCHFDWLSEWLEMVSDRTGDKMFRSGKICFVNSVDTLPYSAKLFIMAMHNKGFSIGAPRFQLDDRGTMNKAIELGDRAIEEKWSREKLDQELTDWYEGLQRVRPRPIRELAAK